MKPQHATAIVNEVKRLQMRNKRSILPIMMETFIRGLGYQDAGRELRRLKEAGKLCSEEGRYFTTATQRPNSLELYV